MFTDLPEPVKLSDKWLTTDFASRFFALQAGSIKVAFYYDYPDSSTFRYRVHNFIEVLEEAQPSDIRPEISAAWFSYADGKHLDRVAEAADILVLCRARYSARLNDLVTRAKSLNKQVLFDVDDLVIDPQFTHLIVHTLDQDIYGEDVWNYWFGYIGRVAAAMGMCDRVITTNQFLAGRLSDSTGKHISVVPNFINREQLNYSDRIFKHKAENNFARDKKIDIGYFSGSPSHNKDFRIASSSLANLMREQEAIRLILVGYLDLQGPISEFSDRIVRLPMQDYIGLQRIIGSAELNIVPLQDNTFTNCKSELKYFEAAVVGTPTLASPTWAFSNSIRDGENGWLVRGHEWYDKIGSAIDVLNRKPADFFELAVRAREQARLSFSWESQYLAVKTALLGR
ncbi:glycosyltransferase [Methylobacterium fujisawaense]|uniref:glycosyltransferase n=1 Tax=Methylobacterium fujisawaense TaxID=107400 RepID=UPI000DB564E4